MVKDPESKIIKEGTHGSPQGKDPDRQIFSAKKTNEKLSRLENQRASTSFHRLARPRVRHMVLIGTMISAT